jgi:hypothetical protein
MVDRGRAQDVNEAARSFAETYRLVYGQAAESAQRQQQCAREFSEAVSINRHFSPRGAMTPTLGRGQCSCQDTLTQQQHHNGDSSLSAFGGLPRRSLRHKLQSPA